MASIHQDARTRVWQIVFRWEGEQYKRTAQTKRKKDAETLATECAEQPIKFKREWKFR